MSVATTKKTRLTITMDPGLLTVIDSAVGPGESRSSVIERWLKAAARQRAHSSLAAETIAYYDGMSAEDAEDATYARAVARSLSARDLDHDADKPRTRSRK